MSKVFMNIVKGKQSKKDIGSTFPSVNPFNKAEVLGNVVKSGKEDVDYAVQCANDSFRNWSKIPSPKRADIVSNALKQVENNKEDLARLMTKEQGKPLRESIGEITKAIAESNFMVGEGYRLNGETAPSEKVNSWTQTVRVPIGPIAAITPWNFPVLTPLRKIIPAIITGNTVVFKPSELTPLTGLRLVELLNAGGIPEGVINLVNGDKETGQFLVEHNLIRGITFTGSTEVGRKITNSASDRMIRVQAEMGGKNPVIIWDYSNVNQAVDTVIGAAFACSGQRCTSISRIIVPESQASEIEKTLAESVNNLKLGNGLDDSTTLGPLISQEQLERVEGYVNRAKKEGARIVVGGHRVINGDCENGYFFAPTLITDVRSDMEIVKEEVFGPVICLQTADSFEEAIELANDTSYGLTAAIFCERLDLVGKFVDEVQSGMVHVNHGTAPESHMPFGGVKSSSYGQGTVGSTTKDFYTDIKTVYIKHS